jgi:hypothetical protein
MCRRLALVLTTASLAGLIALGGAPARAGGVCPSGEVQVKGRVTDAATGLPLDETASVGIEPLGSGSPADGAATNSNSRYSVCLLPDTYRFTLLADSYRTDAAATADVVVADPGPVVAHFALTPKGKVLSGRVTNLGGVPKFASVGIWRRNALGRWVGLDGIGNDMPSGIWSFRVPRLGRYRINAAVDSHWARWYDGDTRLRHARVVIVDEDTTFINGLDTRVPFCHPAPDICVPPGFLT